MHKPWICSEKTENVVILSHESDVSGIWSSLLYDGTPKSWSSAPRMPPSLSEGWVLQFLFLPALMNLSLPCYSTSNSWSFCFACQCSFPSWDIIYPLARCIFNLNQKYMVMYFIMLQTTICILYLIKFFCHFPYDFCILHVPEHFNSYCTCNVMKKQKKWTQHGFVTSKYQCFSVANQTAQWYI